MARPRISPRRFVDGQAVVDVLPIVGGGVGRVDAERLNGIDDLQHALDPWPTRDPQQDVAAGPDIGHRRAGVPRRDSLDDVDARDDSTEIAGGPAYEGEDTARCERQDASSLIENLFLRMMAKANPVLDALFQPQELDMGEIAHATAPSREECRAETSSVRLALIWPAAQLISTPGLASSPRRDLRNSFV